MNGIQPICPSLNATRKRPNRSSTPLVSQSASAWAAPWYVSASETARGASTDVMGNDDDDPMCRLTTVSVTSHAAHNGSQCDVWMLGNFSRAGFSENAIANDPFVAQRFTSVAARCGSQ